MGQLETRSKLAVTSLEKVVHLELSMTETLPLAPSVGKVAQGAQASTSVTSPALKHVEIALPSQACASLVLRVKDLTRRPSSASRVAAERAKATTQPPVCASIVLKAARAVARWANAISAKLITFFKMASAQLHVRLVSSWNWMPRQRNTSVASARSMGASNVLLLILVQLVSQ